MQPGIDKHGRAFKVLQQLQRQELTQWKTVLQPTAYASLENWAMRHVEADSNRQLHQVPVGCELHHYVMELGVAKADEDMLA